MGFLRRLFGGNEEQKGLVEAFAHIRRIIEDEPYQVSLVNPSIRDAVSNGPAYDRDPNGEGPFGFIETNPIPANGPVGELAYLSRLETSEGERILFHRIGAIGRIDVFEAVTFSGSEWFVLFVSLYHPRRSRLAPDGFRITREPAQFSGFHKFCREFPYDFVEMKQTEKESGLIFAYIAIDKVTQQIRNGVFQRPLAHRIKLDLVNNRLTSISVQ